jgi:hypothetical protein
MWCLGAEQQDSDNMTTVVIRATHPRLLARGILVSLGSGMSSVKVVPGHPVVQIEGLWPWQAGCMTWLLVA